MEQTKLNIAILGTRGIPNRYGGFEQFAEYVSLGLKEKGHDVTVYNPHFHNDVGINFRGVDVCYQYCPEDKIGSLAHFLYDYRCLQDALKKEFDIILECGYGTAALSYLLLPIKKSKVVTNMDGIEWKRSKFSPNVKKLMRWLERVGAQKSHHLIADNEGIKKFLYGKYGKTSTMIPYGATIFEEPDSRYLKKYNLSSRNYLMLIARLEPANNIEMILDGYDRSNSDLPFLVIGNHKTEHGQYFKERFKHNKQIRFLGGIYDQEEINNLRYFSSAYFHGHSVGGTNPSLLEAMACSSLVIANHNIFNYSVLKDGGVYFRNAQEVSYLLNNFSSIEGKRDYYINECLNRIRTVYDWDIIINQYDNLFKEVCGIDSEVREGVYASTLSDEKIAS